MPWHARADGLVLRVRVTPRGGRDAVDGIVTLSDGQKVLKVRVRAVPEDGAANEAVRLLLAKALRLPASAIRLEAGATARLKTFRMEGDAKDLTARLVAVLSPTTGTEP